MIATELSEVDFGRTRIEYRVRRSRRRRTVAISVDPSLGVLVTAPEGVPVHRLDGLVHDKAGWIVERLREVRRREHQLPPREFVSGESYLYLGRSYRLKVVAEDGLGEPRLIGGRLCVPSQRALDGPERASMVRATLESWYRLHASQRLPERVWRWSRLVGVAKPRVDIRDQQRRWGSCDSQQTIRFNWRIIQAPMALVDYVVVHELAHLVERGHSRAYWALLGRVMPDYERRRVVLRKIGPRLEW